ncbi:MAG: phosphatidylglycerophosphatase A [Candidatus Omnitrophica bacterium]|nr:phosphatidylglycerophosphatase A [Candidatus Omnitrophota bacterium]
MKKLSKKDTIVVLISTLFGVGYTPLCPGTASCVVAVALFILIKSRIVFFFVTLASTIIAFLICTRAEKIFAEKDSKKIVIDDFSGMLITYLFLPKDINILFIPAGFFLFRMLDMLKIPPADKIESLPGAKGIVGDDVAAGIYSLLVIQAVRFIFPIV